MKISHNPIPYFQVKIALSSTSWSLIQAKVPKSINNKFFNSKLLKYNIIVIITLFSSLLSNATSKSQGKLLAANKNTLSLLLTTPSN